MSASRIRGPDILKTNTSFQPKLSVLKILHEELRRNGDHIALIDGDTGETITFSKLLHKSRSIAAGLQEKGVSRGDVVVLCCDKSILAYSLLLGVMFTGATAVLAPPSHADAIDKLASGEPVKALFYDSAFSPSVSLSIPRMTPPPSLLGKVDPSDPVIATLLDSSPGFNVFEVKDITKHVPVVIFSSGTTGHPKGIELSDLGVQINAVLTPCYMESLCIASPLCCISAFNVLLGSILYNYTLVLTNSKDARRRLRVVQKYKVVSMFTSMSDMVQYISEPSLIGDVDLSSLKRLIIGGEVMLPAVVRKFAKMLKGLTILDIVYGTTEAGILSNLTVRDVAYLRLGEVGKVKPGVEIKILDDDGHIVHRGFVGRIWVKTLAIKGYWRRDDLNRSFLDSEGFYDTGDAGVFNDDGILFSRGKVCDLINYKGTMTSPPVLEDLLMKHPAVNDVAVVGKPHPSDIQHATAFVVLKPQYQAHVSDYYIIDYVDEHVEDSERLYGGVNFLDYLPRVANGKIVRSIL